LILDLFDSLSELFPIFLEFLLEISLAMLLLLILLVLYICLHLFHRFRQVFIHLGDLNPHFLLNTGLTLGDGRIYLTNQAISLLFHILNNSVQYSLLFLHLLTYRRIEVKAAILCPLYHFIHLLFFLFELFY